MKRTIRISRSTSGIGLDMVREFAKTKQYNIIFNKLETNGQQIVNNIASEFIFKSCIAMLTC